MPPKSETASGLRYSLNQEKYLRVFLRDGEVPIDNSACERALRNFTIGRRELGDHEHSAGCAGQCDDLQCHGDSPSQ